MSPRDPEAGIVFRLALALIFTALAYFVTAETPEHVAKENATYQRVTAR